MEQSEAHFISLFDHQTFESMSTHPLDPYECGYSMISCSFSDDKNFYYCVGTAYVLPEESEPAKVIMRIAWRFLFSFTTSFGSCFSDYNCFFLHIVLTCICFLVQGRILVFAVEDGGLKLIVKKETKGGVYALNAFNGKLLAAINQKIQLYKWMTRDDGSHELESECGHDGQTLALYIQTRGDFIVVGDLMKSISLLVYKVSIC
jgi:DNA damage-binding protein 1